MKVRTVVTGPKMVVLPAGKYLAEISRVLEPREGNTRLGIIFRMIEYVGGRAAENPPDLAGWDLTDWLELEPEKIENDWVQRKEKTKLIRFQEALALEDEFDTADLVGQQVYLVISNRTDQNGIMKEQVDAYLIAA